MRTQIRVVPGHDRLLSAGAVLAVWATMVTGAPAVADPAHGITMANSPSRPGATGTSPSRTVFPDAARTASPPVQEPAATVPRTPDGPRGRSRSISTALALVGAGLLTWATVLRRRLNASSRARMPVLRWPDDDEPDPSVAAEVGRAGFVGRSTEAPAADRRRH